MVIDGKIAKAFSYSSQKIILERNTALVGWRVEKLLKCKSEVLITMEIDRIAS